MTPSSQLTATIFATVMLAAGAALAQTSKDQLADLSQVPQLHETTEQRDARMQWFRDAKFGLVWTSGCKGRSLGCSESDDLLHRFRPPSDAPGDQFEVPSRLRPSVWEQICESFGQGSEHATLLDLEGLARGRQVSICHLSDVASASGMVVLRWLPT